jgi:hypothetical protein
LYRCHIYNETNSRKALEYNRPEYFCFIHSEKAYDNLELNTALEIVEINNVPNGLVVLVKDMHVINFTSISVVYTH